MEFMEGGKVDDREYMERHHIATHEVDVHTHTVIQTATTNTRTYTHTNILIQREREGGREVRWRREWTEEGGREGKDSCKKVHIAHPCIHLWYAITVVATLLLQESARSACLVSHTSFSLSCVFM